MIGLPRIYSVLIGTGATLVALGAVWLHGNHVGSTKTERDHLSRVAAWQTSVGTLARNISDKDAQLRIEQQRTAQVQTVEVIKHVTKYRDRVIKDTVIVDCIDNSGLLDILNAAMPTVPASTDKASGRSDGATAADASVRWSGDGRHSGN